MMEEIKKDETRSVRCSVKYEEMENGFSRYQFAVPTEDLFEGYGLSNGSYFECNINDELKVLDNSYISDANYIGDRWKVKIVLVGNSDQITNSLNKLKNMEKYTINEYNIDGKKGNIAVKLDLIRKK